MNTIGITGHRLKKLHGYNELTPWYSQLRSELYRRFLSYIKQGYTRFIQGGAIGTDMISAEVLLDIKKEKGIELVTAVPFEGQEGQWPPQQQARYRHILSSSDRVVIVNGGGYSKAKMHQRNEWICTESNRLFAVWDGSNSGTGVTIGYAEGMNLPIDVLDPRKIIL